MQLWERLGHDIDTEDLTTSEIETIEVEDSIDIAEANEPVAEKTFAEGRTYDRSKSGDAVRTGNLVYAMFQHDTSRALDPQATARRPAGLPVALLLLHPPSETPSQTPEADGVASGSGCV